MDEWEILTLLSNGQRRTVSEIVEGGSITSIDLMMLAQKMKRKGWVELKRKAQPPWLQILPLGEQALAAHRAVVKSELELDS